MKKSHKRNRAQNEQDCQCGFGVMYAECCGRFIDGQQNPPTPEELMRSRYTAYSQASIEYIQRTMLPPASDGFDPQEARQWAQAVKWSGLEVIAVCEGDRGTVEFRARYAINGKVNTLHEISEFRFEEGRWYYVDGVPSEH